MKRIMFIAAVMGLATLVQAEELEGKGREREGRRPRREKGDDFRAGPPKGRGGSLVERLSTDPKAAARLGLSDDQISDLKSKMTAIDAREKELHAAMQELGRKQMELLQSGNAEREVIYQIIDQLGDVRTQLAKSRIDRLFVVQSVLTEEQQAKMREHMKARDGKKGGSRRSGEKRSGERQGGRDRQRESEPQE